MPRSCVRIQGRRSRRADGPLNGNLYMGVKQTGAIERCIFGSRLPSIMFTLKSVKLYLSIAPIWVAPI